GSRRDRSAGGARHALSGRDPQLERLARRPGDAAPRDQRRLPRREGPARPAHGERPLLLGADGLGLSDLLRDPPARRPGLVGRREDRPSGRRRSPARGAGQDRGARPPAGLERDARLRGLGVRLPRPCVEARSPEPRLPGAAPDPGGALAGSRGAGGEPPGPLIRGRSLLPFMLYPAALVLSGLVRLALRWSGRPPGAPPA